MPLSVEDLRVSSHQHMHKERSRQSESERRTNAARGKSISSEELSTQRPIIASQATSPLYFCTAQDDIDQQIDRRIFRRFQ